MHKFICLAVLIPLILFGVFFISCGGSSSSAKLATVRVSVSDPTTCAAPQGSFSHIYVTVSDVLIHRVPPRPIAIQVGSI
jgi:hypothetical protein